MSTRFQHYGISLLLGTLALWAHPAHCADVVVSNVRLLDTFIGLNRDTGIDSRTYTERGHWSDRIDVGLDNGFPFYEQVATIAEMHSNVNEYFVSARASVFLGVHGWSSYRMANTKSNFTIQISVLTNPQDLQIMVAQRLYGHTGVSNFNRLSQVKLSQEDLPGNFVTIFDRSYSVPFVDAIYGEQIDVTLIPGRYRLEISSEAEDPGSTARYSESTEIETSVWFFWPQGTRVIVNP